MKVRLPVLAILLSLSAASVAHADLIETNVPNGSGELPIGVPDTTTYGELFSVPGGGDTQLNSVSFYFDGDLTQAYIGIAAWTNNGAGPALFASTPFSATYGSQSSGGPYKEITVNTGGLVLTPGQEYVAFFSVAGISGDSGWDYMEYGSGAGNDGGFAFSNDNGASPDHADWNGCVGNCNLSLAYAMDFSPPSGVPVPASLALFGFGLAGLGATQRRKVQAG